MIIYDDIGAYWEAFDMQPWPGKSDAWATAYVGKHLIQTRCIVDYPEILDLLEQTAQWLIECERPRGGWGYNNQTRADVDTTCNAIVFLDEMGFDCRQNSYSFIMDHVLQSGKVRTFLPRWEGDSWSKPSWEILGTFLQAAFRKKSNFGETFSIVCDDVEKMTEFIPFWWVNPHYSIRELALAYRDIKIYPTITNWQNVDTYNLSFFDLANLIILEVCKFNKTKAETYMLELLNKLQVVAMEEISDEIILVAPSIGQNVPKSFSHFDISMTLKDCNGIFAKSSMILAFDMFKKAFLN